MPRLAGDIPYRLLGGGQPTQAANRSNSALVNPQSKDHHNASMSFDGVTDAGLLLGVVDLEISNTWTVMVWVLPGDLAPISEQQIYGIGPLSTPKNNGIELVIEAGGVFAAKMYTSGGTIFKKRSLVALDTAAPGTDGFFFGNSWHQIVVTWDNAIMRVYRNGVLMNDDMVNETDIGGSQTNTDRSITLGSAFYPISDNKMFGLIHSAAHWTGALSDAAVMETYNSGVGGSFDLNLGQGDYTQQGDLKSWYRLAATPGEALLQSQAPGGFPLTTTQTSEKVVNSSPEGSFFDTVVATRFYTENAELQGVGNAMTIAAWVRPASLPAEGVTQDVCRFTTLDTDKLALGITTSGGVSYWVYEVSDSTNSTVNTVVGTTPVVIDTWYHILGCKNDTFIIRFFVNGLDDITPIVAGIAVTSNVARFTGIAVDPDAVNDPFDGAIDTIALWDVPISENSVKAVYNGGWRNIDLREVTPSYSEANSLVQWWRFGSTALNEPLRPQQMLSTGYDITGGSLEQIDKLKIGTGLMGNCATFNDASGVEMATALPVGIADVFTISMWLKPNNTTTDTQYPLYIGPEQPSTSNSITWKIDGDVVDDPFVIEVISSAGVTIQRIAYATLLEVDSWQNLTMVWTGSAITLYLNGTFVAGVVEEVNAGSVIDSSRFVGIGGSTRVLAAPAGMKFDGRISHVGFWNVDLTPNSIRTVSSQAHNLDLRYNKDDYAHAQYLQHYWKLGEDRFGTGRDFMDTTRGNNLLSLTVETGTIPIHGDSPESLVVIAPPIAPPPSLFSLAFNGTNEFMGSGGAFDLGTVDAWTLMGWMKWDQSAGSTFDIAYRHRGAANQNLVSLHVKTPVLAQVIGRIQIVVFDSGGSERKDLTWYDVISDNAWVQVVFTFDGSLGGDPVVFYRDGVDEGIADAIGKDLSLTQDNSVARSVDVGSTAAFSGSEFPGLQFQYAMWSNALTSVEVAAIYNSGVGGFDLLTNSGNYVSSATLLHWWQLGQNIANIGEDTGNHSTLIDLSGVNMDVSNRVSDFP